MTEPSTKRQLKTFPGLTADAFMHPWDVQASRALKSVPGFDTVVRKIMEYGFERVYYLGNIADNVRVTEVMFPRLHRTLLWGCKILGVDVPELYVSMDEQPNAFTYGHTRPFIVMTSGLLDMLSEQERLYVIGHELGHIKCGHVLYTVMAENMAAMLGLLGKATLGIGSLVGMGLAVPLYDWYRKAELSADRAALLCVQDLDVAISVFMKLAGGAASMFDEMNRDEFMRQIRAYEDADESTLNQAYKIMLTAFRTHPYPIMRAKHLDAWAHSSAYMSLLNSELRPQAGA